MLSDSYDFAMLVSFAANDQARLWNGEQHHRWRRSFDVERCEDLGG